MNKKGISLSNFVIGLMFFSLFIIGFAIIPNQTMGIWDTYNYAMPSNNVSDFDKSSDVSQTIRDLACDINPEDEGCPEVKKNVFEQVSNFVQGMVQSGYSALITIYTSFSIGKALITDVGGIIGVPGQVLAVFIDVMLFVLVFAIIIFIFNRSDV